MKKKKKIIISVEISSNRFAENENNKYSSTTRINQINKEKGKAWYRSPVY